MVCDHQQGSARHAGTWVPAKVSWARPPLRAFRHSSQHCQPHLTHRIMMSLLRLLHTSHFAVCAVTPLNWTVIVGFPRVLVVLLLDASPCWEVWSGVFGGEDMIDAL